MSKNWSMKMLLPHTSQRYENFHFNAYWLDSLLNCHVTKKHISDRIKIQSMVCFCIKLVCVFVRFTSKWKKTRRITCVPSSDRVTILLISSAFLGSKVYPIATTTKISFIHCAFCFDPFARLFLFHSRKTTQLRWE